MLLLKQVTIGLLNVQNMFMRLFGQIVYEEVIWTKSLPHKEILLVKFSPDSYIFIMCCFKKVLNYKKTAFWNKKHIASH